MLCPYHSRLLSRFACVSPAAPHPHPREVNAIIIIITTVITVEIYINKSIISLSVTVRDPSSRAASSAAPHVHHARAWLSRDRTREPASLSAALGSHGPASRTCATGRVCVRNVPSLLDNVPSLRHCLPFCPASQSALVVPVLLPGPPTPPPPPTPIPLSLW